MTKLHDKNPASGLFVLDVSELSISSVRLQWNHQSPPKNAGNMTSERRFCVVRIPRDFEAVDVRVEPPSRSMFPVHEVSLIIFIECK